jgi:uncharacterized membrane protein
MMTRLRNYFLTGFIVTAPLAITAYLAWSLIGWVDSWVKPYIPARYNPDTYLPFAVPGFGLIVAVVLITLVGFLTANFIGRSIVHYGEYLLDRMPLIRSVYRGLKQIFETVLSQKADMFKKAALIEYPRRGAWAIVFIATDKDNEVSRRLNDGVQEDTIAVFLPSTPNPTTGFLMYVPRKDVIELSMSIEDAAKLIISAGLVAPEEHQAKMRALAASAKAKRGKNGGATAQASAAGELPAARPETGASPKAAE